MEISNEAKKSMEHRVNRILREIDVPEKDRDEIKRELVSNYTDASMMKAQARGAASVEKTDMEAAFEASEEPEEIASMYMASYVSSLHRAGFVRRLVAYLLDFALIAIAMVLALSPLLVPKYLVAAEEFHHMRFYFEYFYLFMTINLIVIFIYFVVCEGFYGMTPGKWLLGLKVLRTDGRKASYKEAMLRTLPKLFIVAIVIDALLMLLYHGKDRQRVFDRIAGTIVIRK